MAVSAVTLRRPAMISVSLLAGMPSSRASAVALMPSGSRNSCLMISPGCTRSRVRTGDLAIVSSLSMVIDDLHIGGTGLGPAKADAPLVIDANAPLTRAVTAQGLQPVPRRHPEILDGSRSIEIGELARGDFLES